SGGVVVKVVTIQSFPPELDPQNTTSHDVSLFGVDRDLPGPYPQLASARAQYGDVLLHYFGWAPDKQGNLPDTIRHLAGSTTDEQPPLQRPGSAYLSLWRMGSIGYGNQGDSGAGVLAFQPLRTKQNPDSTWRTQPATARQPRL